MLLISKELDSKKATDLILIRVEKISGDINKVSKMNKGSSSFNIEELKDKMKMEDFFYDTVLKGIAKRTGTKIKFDGDRVIFSR